MKIACYIRNASVADSVKTILAQSNHESLHFDDEATLLRSVRQTGADLILIDIAVQPADDDSTLAWLNLRSGDHTPVIVLSPLRTGEMAAHMLNNGAGDFVRRPVEAVELVARINALLRRCAPPQTRRSLTYFGYTLDRESSLCTFLDQPIELTPREFSMAWMFFSSPGIFISRETIGLVIWSADSEVAGRTIEQHVYKLRKKLQVGDEKVVMIRTAYSQGYRLELCTPE